MKRPYEGKNKAASNLTFSPQPLPLKRTLWSLTPLI